MSSNENYFNKTSLTNHYLSQYAPKAVRSEEQWTASMEEKREAIAHLRKSQMSNVIVRSAARFVELFKHAA